MKTALTAQAAITRTRRDLVLGVVLKIAFAAAIMACLLLAPQAAQIGVLSVVAIAWIALSFTSARGSRLSAGSASLIAAGQFEEAEERIDGAIRAFSLFRAPKLQTLHNLALLRHAQRRWQESAMLCRALLGQRLGTVRGLSRSSRLILADALLELGDANGAYESIRALYDQRLSLTEVLNLLLIQLDYSSRVGAWGQMMTNVVTKVQLAELMPAHSAARVQALLALAARNVGRDDWAQWLRARVELLWDVQQLATERPVLWDVWKKQ